MNALMNEWSNELSKDVELENIFQLHDSVFVKQKVSNTSEDIKGTQESCKIFSLIFDLHLLQSKRV